MLEIKEEVKAVRVLCRCSYCGIGNMVFTGIETLGFPPQYEHQCSYCEETTVFDIKYPEIRFE